METIKIDSAVSNQQLEIKKCPFCGGKPYLKRFKNNGLTLKCGGCGIGMQQRTIHFDLVWLESKLIEIYNNRS